MRTWGGVFVITVASTLCVACSSDDDDAGTAPATAAPPAKSDAEFKTDVTTGIQQVIAVQLQALNKAAIDLQAAAPLTQGRGWDRTQDAAAIQAMKDAWRRARIAYEHIEGAVAPIFPDLDAAIDARYDDYMAMLATVGGDTNLFDDHGVTGMHGIERIIFVDTTPAFVVAFEKVLPGYKAAAFPATEQEAADFKNKLCAKLISDTKIMVDQWLPAKIDLATAYQGLISLMNEQREKVTKAATGEEESRYSQLTLADIHANLEGTVAAYKVFEPWILAKTNAQDAAKDGPTHDRPILSGFGALQVDYDANPGDAIPQPPATWSAESPSAEDLQTPFGKLFSSVKEAVDPNRDGSVVFEMNAVADILAFPRFKTQQ